MANTATTATKQTAAERNAEDRKKARDEAAARKDAASAKKASDPTQGCDEAIDAVIEDLNPTMNDDQFGHPALSRAIQRLTEAKNALHDFRASRGFLPEDTFPADPPNLARTEPTSGR